MRTAEDIRKNLWLLTETDCFRHAVLAGCIMSVRLITANEKCKWQDCIWRTSRRSVRTVQGVLYFHSDVSFHGWSFNLTLHTRKNISGFPAPIITKLVSCVQRHVRHCYAKFCPNRTINSISTARSLPVTNKASLLQPPDSLNSLPLNKPPSEH
jgi:hypothetical protein